MKHKGRILRIFPKDTNTDEIIAGRYKYDELDLKKLAVHTFESIDPLFYADASKARDPLIVAATNFGCGSSREQAPQVLKTCGISCVIAESFARIFYRNCFNIGLPVIECKDMTKKVAQGDKIVVDFELGIIQNMTKKEEYDFKPIPKFMQELLEAGGLMPYLMSHGGYRD